MDIRKKTALEQTVNSILARDDDDLRRTEREIAQLIEPRRAPNGDILFVPRGTSRELSIEAENYLSIRGIMDWKRKAKRRRYLQKKGDSHYHGPKIVGEGDSWLEYPCNKDNGEWIGDKYALLSLAKAGDRWADVINDENGIYDDGTPMGLFKTVELEKPDIVILSAGGNDVVNKIEQYIEPFANDRPAEDYIKSDFDLVLNYVEYNYRVYTDRLINMGCKVLVHSYDYPDPRASGDGGQWIGGPMEVHRKIPGPALWREIVNVMLRRFHARLKAVADTSNGKVHLVELFETIGNSDSYAGPDRSLWNDEMHGTEVGFGKIAKKFEDKIKLIHP